MFSLFPSLQSLQREYLTYTWHPSAPLNLVESDKIKFESDKIKFESDKIKFESDKIKFESRQT